MLRKRRFADLVSRQLDLFEEDARELLAEAEEADAAWTHASAEESEKLYGDYQLVVDAIAERLLDLRETYAATLDEGAADDYRTTYDRSAGRRFPRFCSMLGD